VRSGAAVSRGGHKHPNLTPQRALSVLLQLERERNRCADVRDSQGQPQRGNLWAAFNVATDALESHVRAAIQRGSR
jgi:hypothetical protein